MKTLNYPTNEHELAAKKFVEIFCKYSEVKTILLMCSCARGKATKDSCLDLGILLNDMKDKPKVKKRFEALYKSVKEFKDLTRIGKYSHIDLYIGDGKIKTKERDWTSGPDDFELEVGNIFIYSKVLYDTGYFAHLKRRYFPYFNEKLRKKKFTEAKMYCLNNLNHVPVYVKRGLYFQAFDRLYKAQQEFMQALFIKRKVYPIAYDKWIKEQYTEILKLPEVYKKIVSLFEIKKFESVEIERKSEILKELTERYL